MCNASNSANIDSTAPLFHNLVTRVFFAGNGDKTYGHVNGVYLKTTAYTGLPYSISDAIMQFITHGYIRLDQNMNTLILTHVSKN